jgi:hypothetical protein
MKKQFVVSLQYPCVDHRYEFKALRLLKSGAPSLKNITLKHHLSHQKQELKKLVSSLAFSTHMIIAHYVTFTYKVVHLPKTVNIFHLITPETRIE